MAQVRGPVVAGTFYPSDPRTLRHTVESLVGVSRPSPSELRAVIVPHAGYIYSGPVAASAYGLLAGRSFKRVVVVGPSHFARFAGIAACEADGWATPLGVVPLDQNATSDIEKLPEAFDTEHSLEVQLPFLQWLECARAAILLLTGDTDGRETADVLEGLVDADTLLVVSSDLSHYHPYETAQSLDRTAAFVIEGLRPEDLGPGAACGGIAIQGALHLAKRRGWNARLIDLRNSGDTAGDRSRVVGYGAFTLG